MDTKELKRLDKELIWHPYTQMKDFEKRDLLFVDRARGVHLFDIDGKKYYDTISSWWCITHGHNHPVIRKHIKDQLERLDQVHFAGTTHKGPIILCKNLKEYLPGELSKFFFSDNGSTAVEVALKMSLQYFKQMGKEKRHLFVSLERGYHGDTIGTMSLGGVPAFEGPFSEITFKSLKVPPPYCYRCPIDYKNYEPGKGRKCSLECFDLLERAIKENRERICALVLEPLLMGAGGMITYPKEYLKRARDITEEYGIHLILDEVATGFGRTGKMFAMDHVKIVPDFLCLSKGITGGTLPLAVTVTKREIFDAFYADYSEGKTFFHGHTFTANPICVSSALGSLEVFKEENVLSRLRDRVQYLQEKKGELFELEIVGDIRGIGMVCAFELVKDKGTREPFPSKKRIGWQVYLEGLKRQLILRPLSDVIYLFLPLCTKREEIDDIIHRTKETLKEVEKTL